MQKARTSTRRLRARDGAMAVVEGEYEARAGQLQVGGPRVCGLELVCCLFMDVPRGYHYLKGQNTFAGAGKGNVF